MNIAFDGMTIDSNFTLLLPTVLSLKYQVQKERICLRLEVVLPFSIDSSTTASS